MLIGLTIMEGTKFYEEFDYCKKTGLIDFIYKLTKASKANNIIYYIYNIKET